MGRFLVVVLVLVGVGLVIKTASSNTEEALQQAEAYTVVEAGPQLNPADRSGDAASQSGSSLAPD